MENVSWVPFIVMLSLIVMMVTNQMKKTVKVFFFFFLCQILSYISNVGSWISQ